MLRNELVANVLVLVIGVNLAAWALTVPSRSISTPVGAPALETVSQSASVALPQEDATLDFATTTATSSESASSTPEN